MDAIIGHLFAAGFDASSEKIKQLYEFGESVKSLKEALDDLRAYRIDVEHNIEENMHQESREVVKKWMEEVNSLLSTAIELINTVEKELSSKTYFMTCLQRADAVSKKLTDVRELRDRKLFPEKMPPRNSMPMQSHFVPLTCYDDAILKALDKKNLKIGVVGGRGSGVSTLLRYLSRKLCEGYRGVLFLSPGTIDQIQIEIGKKLDLDNHQNWEARTTLDRCALIHQSLHNQEYAFIIDDLNSSVKLEDIGIELTKKTKLIFGTNNKRVCYEMEVDKCIEMEPITTHDAYKMLCMKAYKEDGANFDIWGVNSICKLCEGNPSLIAMVGRALRSRGSDVRVWKEAADALRKTNDIKFEDKAKEAELRFAYACQSELCNLFELTPELEKKIDEHMAELQEAAGPRQTVAEPTAIRQETGQMLEAIAEAVAEIQAAVDLMGAELQEAAS